MNKPPLRPLHPEKYLIQSKLDHFDSIPTEDLIRSLQIGAKDSLKTRPDGTILDGHHRIAILRARAVNVDALPRETIAKD